MAIMARCPPSKGLARDVGVGTRLGLSLARKVAREGHPLARLSNGLGPFPIYIADYQ